MQNWKKIEQWFEANKLSLSTKKTKSTLFHKIFFTDDIFKIPDLKIQNLNIERNSSIEFLREMLDERISLGIYKESRT